MTEVLNIKNLSIAFGDAPPVVDGVSFTVNAGETVALVGRVDQANQSLLYQP